MLAVQCDQCDHRFVADDKDMGRKVSCPNCRAWVRVPLPPRVLPVQATPVDHPALRNLDTALSVGKWLLILFVIGGAFAALATALLREAARPW